MAAIRCETQTSPPGYDKAVGKFVAGFAKRMGAREEDVVVIILPTGECCEGAHSQGPIAFQ